MFDKTFAYLQYLIPQQLLTRLVGKLAESRNPWLKKRLLHLYIKHYNIDLQQALECDLDKYACFNDFFIRQLKPGLRPLAEAKEAVLSPVDGVLLQRGSLKKRELIQAKGIFYDLQNLLAQDDLVSSFEDGLYATFYLAPRHYHRIHMPITGKLIKTIFVPGKLFSVNKITSEVIPNLYGRNERLIALFATPAGPMAIILVGALIVGSIKTTWMDQPIRHPAITTQTFAQGPELQKGEELGYFKMGSSVIILFSKNSIEWNQSITVGDETLFGQEIGKIISFS